MKAELWTEYHAGEDCVLVVVVLILSWSSIHHHISPKPDVKEWRFSSSPCLRDVRFTSLGTVCVPAELLHQCRRLQSRWEKNRAWARRVVLAGDESVCCSQLGFILRQWKTSQNINKHCYESVREYHKCEICFNLRIQGADGSDHENTDPISDWSLWVTCRPSP